MPAMYWGEAVHLLNRSLIKSLQGKTPYEAWHGRTPAVGHIRTFGCIAYVKELNQLGKLDDRSKPGVFIWYAEGAKAYDVPARAGGARRTPRLGLDKGGPWRLSTGSNRLSH
jgi:hypothetical protein